MAITFVESHNRSYFTLGDKLMVIILGGSGYVGQAYQQMFRERGIDFVSLARSELDYTDSASLLVYLREMKPKFLINAAGYTGKPNVDACETDKANCLFGNAVLPDRIAEACAEAAVLGGMFPVVASILAVAPTARALPKRTRNFTFRQNNCSFYSGTKALGEEILDKYNNVYIWRLRIPFNNEDNPRNYITKLLRYENLLEATNSISHLNEFAASTFACWEKQVPFGTYNITNPGEITTCQMVELIKAANVSDKDFKFFDNEAEFMQNAAIAPRSNCILDSSKLASVGIMMTPVAECVESLLEELAVIMRLISSLNDFENIPLGC